MFNTLAYYFGYGDEGEQGEAGNNLTSSQLENTPAADFNITELSEEDGWGLVEKVLMQRRNSEHQATDRSVLDSFEHCERENLMIEHPSIFVPNLNEHDAEMQDENAAPTTELAVSRNRVPGSAKRSQRRASRQMLKNKAQQKKRCVQKPLKQKSENRNFNKMRLIVQQPRKHY